MKPDVDKASGGSPEVRSDEGGYRSGGTAEEGPKPGPDRSERMQLVVGFDYNVRSVIAAYRVHDREMLLDVCSVVSERGFVPKLIDVGEGEYYVVIRGVVEVPNLVSYVKEGLRKFVEKYPFVMRYRDVKVERGSWAWREIKRSCRPIPSVFSYVIELVEEYGVVPNWLFVYDLELYLRKKVRRWRKWYVVELRKLLNRLMACLNRLSEKYDVIAKIEWLPYVDVRSEVTDRVRGWRYTKLMRALVHCTRKGIRVVAIEPAGTSRYCPVCDSVTEVLSYRELRCTKCGRVWDRDEMAAINVARSRAVKYVLK
ncbi:MAG: hypothetical protein DRJ40_05480 [Thermoprotei archaeon]|nr:MAG: hypothetical protein DRJ40_04045 [Thermoprotei archaeon]RLE56845.1 MAG: hypothetical protein DRJ40_05480 [Thermoprotei archaeon]